MNWKSCVASAGLMCALAALTMTLADASPDGIKIGVLNDQSGPTPTLLAKAPSSRRRWPSRISGARCWAADHPAHFGRSPQQGRRRDVYRPQMA